MSLLDVENRVTNLNDEFFLIQYSKSFFLIAIFLILIRTKLSQQ